MKVMSLSIEAVETSEQRKQFLKAPLAIYKASCSWIRPLDEVVLNAIDFQKNPFYRNGAGKAYLAIKDGQIVGRILAHFSRRHERLHDESAGYFGLFESVNDPVVARALFKSAEDFLSKNQCKVIRGPFNITAAQEMGIVTDGFNKRPGVDMVYTPDWYPKLLEEMGFQRCFAMETWRSEEIQDWKCPKIDSIQKDHLEIKIRSLRPDARDEDMELVRDVVNSAFLGNWNFIPITREEWNLQIGELLMVMDPDIVQMAEINGVTVAVSLVVPDYNYIFHSTNGKLFHWRSIRLLAPASIGHAVVILFAVRKNFQGLGISRRLNQNLMKALKKKGYRSLSITWIGDQNQPSITQARYLGMQKLHRVAMYEKRLY